MLISNQLSQSQGLRKLVRNLHEFLDKSGFFFLIHDQGDFLEPSKLVLAELVGIFVRNVDFKTTCHSKSRTWKLMINLDKFLDKSCFLSLICDHRGPS